jgi:hypothetical protein
MNLKAALLVMAAVGACLLVPACGGGGGGGGGSSSPSSNGGDTGSGNGSSSSGSGGSAGDSGAGTGGTSGSASSSSCQSQPIAGGDLFVAEQGPVGVTLVSNGGLSSQYTFAFLYDNVFGIPTNNQQDKWGAVAPPPFPPGTPVGASIQVQLQPFGGFVNGEQTPSSFPKGIPVELRLTIDDNNIPPGPLRSSSTASIRKDIPNDFWHTATVTYGANNTATVTFFPDASGSHFSVALTNVFGKGSPPASASGC